MGNKVNGLKVASHTDTHKTDDDEMLEVTASKVSGVQWNACFHFVLAVCVHAAEKNVTLLHQIEHPKQKFKKTVHHNNLLIASNEKLVQIKITKEKTIYLNNAHKW